MFRVTCCSAACSGRWRCDRGRAVEDVTVAPASATSDRAGNGLRRLVGRARTGDRHHRRRGVQREALSVACRCCRTYRSGSPQLCRTIGQPARRERPAPCRWPVTVAATGAPSIVKCHHGVARPVRSGIIGGDVISGRRPGVEGEISVSVDRWCQRIDDRLPGGGLPARSLTLAVSDCCHVQGDAAAPAAVPCTMALPTAVVPSG